MEEAWIKGHIDQEDKVEGKKGESAVWMENKQLITKNIRCQGKVNSKDKIQTLALHFIVIYVPYAFGSGWRDIENPSFSFETIEYTVWETQSLTLDKEWL